MKTHFNLDGVFTACGMHMGEYYFEVSTSLKEVTCSRCRSNWERLKRKWDKEERIEREIQRKTARAIKQVEENKEYIKKWRSKNGNI